MNFFAILRLIPLRLCVMSFCLFLHAETGQEAWLRYARVPGAPSIPAALTSSCSTLPCATAQSELQRGVRAMLNRALRLSPTPPSEDAIVLGTVSQLRQFLPEATTLPPDTYLLKTVRSNGALYTLIAGSTDRAVLYGVFAFLRKIALGQPLAPLDETHSPYAPVRWINQWDNLDGTIERGYGGPSIFWENGRSRPDLTRVSEYARLLASLGISACSINNVNANPRVLTPDFIPEIARIADAFRPWGVRVAISVDFGSPQSLGGLSTFDPLDPQVAEWWKSRADALYRAVPDLAGFVLKADSEGRVGPSAYHRTHADAANVVARALQPHNGLLFYRGFVYDHHMDWRNPKNDRARAAYDNFQPLDGQFDANVIVQVKNGPIDFQVREPFSPLFAALPKTRQAIELQITQEYMGQARHTVYLAPMWAEVFKDIAPPRAFVGVANVGLDPNWLHNHLSQANLYAFGRLAWDPALSPAQILDEWSLLTFGPDPRVLEILRDIQLTSWRTYENYTGPLGLQTLTDIVGNHYGVAVEASERNGWGQWHNADERGAGMDRTAATGTGFTAQYPPATARLYESRATCPDDLLLFFHHVPYTHRLHSGETVIQRIYDSHYEGHDAVASYVQKWRSLEGLVDPRRYRDVLAQLEYQEGQAEVWRDAVTRWFLRTSGVPDERGRAGRYPNRYEAEAMKLEGYVPRDVVPWEAASGQAVICPQSRCAATQVFQGPSGWHRLRIRYFDQNNGVSRFRVLVNGQSVDEWTASDRLPTSKIDATSSALREIEGIALRPNDEIRIESTPDGAEAAPLDYLEILKP